MGFPALTAGYAGVLGLIYLAISGWVIAGRGKHNVLHGDGGPGPLSRRVRAHANFAEYVPLILVLVGLLELGGASRGTLNVLLLVLVVARIAHPIGMVAPENSVQQYAFRATGAVATFLVLLIASVLLLVRAF